MAYDTAIGQFACHKSKEAKESTCAGFLLRNSENNIGVRLSQINGKIDMTQVGDGGYPLFDNYREMAIANGVDPDDPALEKCRADDERMGR